MENQLIGIENEFEMFRREEDGSDTKLDGKDYLKRFVKLAGKPFFEKSEYAFRLWTGGALYSDGEEPEIATAPVEVRKGCIRQAVSLLFQDRNNLIGLVDCFNNKYGNSIWLKGYSTHCNFSALNPERTISMLADSAAVPLLLLFEQRHSMGVMLRDKYDRVELAGDYIVSREQMMAAMAYMLGMVNSISKGVELILPEPDGNWYEPTLGLGMKAMKRDSFVPIKTKGKRKKKVSLQQLLEHNFRLFREEIGRFAEDEVELLEEYVSGKRKLEADYNKLPKGYGPVVKDFNCDLTMPELASAFARASKGREKVSGILLQTEGMDWNTIDYNLSFLNGKPVSSMNYMYVDRKNLVKFYSALDSSCIGEKLRKASPEKREEMLSMLANPQ